MYTLPANAKAFSILAAVRMRVNFLLGWSAGQRPVGNRPLGGSDRRQDARRLSQATDPLSAAMAPRPKEARPRRPDTSRWVMDKGVGADAATQMLD
jgi:hypothetical protein